MAAGCNDPPAFRQLGEMRTASDGEREVRRAAVEGMTEERVGLWGDATGFLGVAAFPSGEQVAVNQVPETTEGVFLVVRVQHQNDAAAAHILIPFPLELAEVLLGSVIGLGANYDQGIFRQARGKGREVANRETIQWDMPLQPVDLLPERRVLVRMKDRNLGCKADVGHGHQEK